VREGGAGEEAGEVEDFNPFEEGGLLGLGWELVWERDERRGIDGGERDIDCCNRSTEGEVVLNVGGVQSLRAASRLFAFIRFSYLISSSCSVLPFHFSLSQLQHQVNLIRILTNISNRRAVKMSGLTSYDIFFASLITSVRVDQMQ
jgi:hypothetical protein